MNQPFTRYLQQLLATAGFCALASFLSPGQAFAAYDTACGPSMYKGRVKKIVVTEGKADPLSGLPVGSPVPHSEVTFTEDGRTSTMTRFEADTPREWREKMFPNSVSEYNSAGLLIREVYVLPGHRHQRTTTCEYDDQNRVIKQTTKTTSPETSQTLDFEYGAGWRRQHFKTAVAAIVVSQVLGSNGEVIREEERNERDGSLRMTATFSYRPGEVERCATDGSGIKYCRTTVKDSHGNEIEIRSGNTYRREVYEYDALGNWISKKTVGNGALAASSTDTVISRRITYW